MKKSVFALLLLSAACTTGSKQEEGAAGPEPAAEVAEPIALDPATFQQGIANGDVILVDVRTPEEAAEGMLPGAEIIDFKAPDFAQRIAGLDKDKTYYVYCLSGARSAKAADVMVSNGFKSVHTLEGGLQAWEASGLEVE